MNMSYDKYFFQSPCQIYSIPIKLPKEIIKEIARLTQKHMKIRNIPVGILGEYLDTE